ncbi:endoribonuclease L-PSP [Fusarium acutatum]|uniref:Endoribonuclease L-PSP n=1 Tax=Fusarium acutatum TaxID=78861 RepID=A0A8H4JE26_9HYPO|nr:endoribonuclease L-PSP [Fusarium acutatum]
MKFIIFFLVFFPAASLSLSKRSCQTFKLESPSDSKGYFDEGSSIRVSELVNCTAERAKENRDDKGNCRIQSPKIGIIANSTITQANNKPLDTSLENKKNILEAARDVADPKTMDNESDAGYRGKVGFVEDNDPNSRIHPGVRPWPDYGEAVHMAEKWEKNDVQEEKSLATRFYIVVPTLVWSSLISLFTLV